MVLVKKIVMKIFIIIFIVFIILFMVGVCLTNRELRRAEDEFEEYQKEYEVNEQFEIIMNEKGEKYD